MVCFTAATNARAPLIWTFGWNKSYSDFAFVTSLYEMSWTQQNCSCHTLQKHEIKGQQWIIETRIRCICPCFPARACMRAVVKCGSRSSPYSPPKAERVTERWRETCNTPPSHSQQPGLKSTSSSSSKCTFIFFKT